MGVCTGRRGTKRLTTRICTGSPRWLNVVVRTLTSPCSGRDLEGRTSRISLMKLVARAHRPRPAELVESGPDNAAGRPGLAFDQHPHRHRGGVPAARREAAEHAVSRCPLVEMEWLRIKLGGKGFIRSASTRNTPEPKIWPTVKSSR